MVLYPNKLPESERVCSGICKFGEECQRHSEITPPQIFLHKNEKHRLGGSSGNGKLKELEHANKKLQDKVSKRSSVPRWDSLKK